MIKVYIQTIGINSDKELRLDNLNDLIKLLNKYSGESDDCFVFIKEADNFITCVVMYVIHDMYVVVSVRCQYSDVIYNALMEFKESVYSIER